MADEDTPSYKDYLGNPIRVGDFVAYAVGSRRSDLNVAIVDQLTISKGKRCYHRGQEIPAVKVRVYESSGRYDHETKQYISDIHRYRAATTNSLDKMVVIDRIPKEIADFLRSHDKERKFGSTAVIGDIDSVINEL